MYTPQHTTPRILYMVLQQQAVEHLKLSGEKSNMSVELRINKAKMRMLGRSKYQKIAYKDNMATEEPQET